MPALSPLDLPRRILPPSSVPMPWTSQHWPSAGFGACTSACSQSVLSSCRCISSPWLSRFRQTSWGALSRPQDQKPARIRRFSGMNPKAHPKWKASIHILPGYICDPRMICIVYSSPDMFSHPCLAWGDLWIHKPGLWDSHLHGYERLHGLQGVPKWTAPSLGSKASNVSDLKDKLTIGIAEWLRNDCFVSHLSQTTCAESRPLSYTHFTSVERCYKAHCRAALENWSQSSRGTCRFTKIHVHSCLSYFVLIQGSHGFIEMSNRFNGVDLASSMAERMSTWAVGPVAKCGQHS